MQSIQSKSRLHHNCAGHINKLKRHCVIRLSRQKFLFPRHFQLLIFTKSPACHCNNIQWKRNNSNIITIIYSFLLTSFLLLFWRNEFKCIVNFMLGSWLFIVYIYILYKCQICCLLKTRHLIFISPVFIPF